MWDSSHNCAHWSRSLDVLPNLCHVTMIAHAERVNDSLHHRIRKWRHSITWRLPDWMPAVLILPSIKYSGSYPSLLSWRTISSLFSHPLCQFPNHQRSYHQPRWFSCKGVVKWRRNTSLIAGIYWNWLFGMRLGSLMEITKIISFGMGIAWVSVCVSCLYDDLEWMLMPVFEVRILCTHLNTCVKMSLAFITDICSKKQSRGKL